MGFFRLVIGHFKSLSHAPVFISYRKGVVCKVKIEVFRDFIAQFVLLSTDPQRGTLSFGLARCFSNQKCHSCMQLNSTSRIKLLITNLANPFYSIWNICTATRYYYLILFYVFVKRNYFFLLKNNSTKKKTIKKGNNINPNKAASSGSST